MSHEPKLNPAEQELENALGQLLPQSTHINRDMLMFRAGIASQRRQQRLWQASSMVLGLLLCVSLSLSFLQEPVTTVRFDTDQLVEPQLVALQQDLQQMPLLTQTPHNLPCNSYLKLRGKVLNDGVEALPNVTASTIDESAITLDNLLNTMSQS